MHVAPLPLHTPPSLIRGKFRSKPWAAVLDEAKRLVESGVVELNLIAGLWGGKCVCVCGGGGAFRGGRRRGGLAPTPPSLKKNTPHCVNAEDTNQYGMDRKDGNGLAEVRRAWVGGGEMSPAMKMEARGPSL